MTKFHFFRQTNLYCRRKIVGNLAVSSALGLDAFEESPIELRPSHTEDDLQVVIRAVYKQVLGNAHLLESERLSSAESLLRNGDVTVRGFVRLVAQSELYQNKFFFNSSAYRSIELNFKHLLGRAPNAQSEITEHVLIYNTHGYEAEIDSYIDSDEYTNSFGENTVPYFRSIRSQTGLKNVTFNRTFSLVRGSATSDAGCNARLIGAIASNLPTKIQALARGTGGYSNTSKRFRLTTIRPNCGVGMRGATATHEVSYEQLSQKVQNIQRTGGKILSITEV
jgi:phycoerythrin-associated linker protein